MVCAMNIIDESAYWPGVARLRLGLNDGEEPDAYYGHLVLRLMASFVLLYTSRVICKGRLTMEEIIFSLKHYWRFVDMEPLELQTLS